MIIFILAFAFILRLVNLNQSLWLDEAVQAITAQKSLGFIFQELSGDFHPPLYYFLMHFWVRIFGSSEIALRMPSVIFGVGTVCLVYLIIKRLTDSKINGLIGSIFLATAPFHIYYSQEARMYSLAAFLTTGSFYFFLRILEDDRGWLKDGRGVGYFLGYFLFTLLALYTDYYVFLVLLAQLIYLLIKKKYKFLILNSLFIILCYLPWLPMFIVQIKTGMLATKNLPEWGKLANVSFLKALPLTFVKFSIGRITIFNKSLYAGIVLVIGLVYGSLFLKAIKGWLKDKLGDVKGTIIIMWFFVPLLVSWIASLFIPNFQPFRLLLILPAFYLVLAMGLGEQEKQEKLGLVLGGVVLLVNLISLGVYYFNPYFQREDWKGAVKYLKSQPNSIVILPSETSNWPIRYYNPGNEIKMIYGTTGVEKVGDLGSASWRMGDLGEGIFYIRYLTALFDPNEKILSELNARGYTKMSEINFNQIPVWEYQK